nr:calcium-transporting ATPase 2, plasma membrane-type-like [Tanacetum cinerariifolium]
KPKSSNLVDMTSNKTPISSNRKSVVLHEWWLIKVEGGSKLAVGGIILRFQMPQDIRTPRNVTCIGIVGNKDNIRLDVKESVSLRRSIGITFRMVTGDNITTAKAIDRKCGILTDDGIAIEGPDFREKSLKVLLIIIRKIQERLAKKPCGCICLRFLVHPFEVFKLTVGEMFNRKPRNITAYKVAVEAMKKIEAPSFPFSSCPSSMNIALLYQAMESEIRQSVVMAISRQPNGRLTPRNFLLNMSSVASRDPAIFLQAAHSSFQIEMVGERPDSKVSNSRSSAPKGLFGGGVFHNILHQFLPYYRISKKEEKTDVERRHKLGGRASQFLVASCFTPGNDIQAFVDLFNAVPAARSLTGSSISGEASVAPVLVKVLELVIKEHVHAAEANAGRSHNAIKPTDQNYRESEAITYDMEHDQDIDGRCAPLSEDDYMHESSNNTKVLENGFDSMAIRFEIQPDIQESLDEVNLINNGISGCRTLVVRCHTIKTCKVISLLPVLIRGHVYASRVIPGKK